MKLIFLDIDGVLNAHEKLPSGYCGICRPQVDQLNRILDAVPDAQLVISSAWRYLILNGSMTMRGFDRLLLTHGVKAEERIHGTTEADPITIPREVGGAFDVEKWKGISLQWRTQQIRRYSGAPVAFVVLDDLPLDIENLVQTECKVGLTAEHADRAIAILTGKEEGGR